MSNRVQRSMYVNPAGASAGFLYLFPNGYKESSTVVWSGGCFIHRIILQTDGANSAWNGLEIHHTATSVTPGSGNSPVRKHTLAAGTLTANYPAAAPVFEPHAYHTASLNASGLPYDGAPGDNTRRFVCEALKAATVSGNYAEIVTLELGLDFPHGCCIYLNRTTSATTHYVNVIYSPGVSGYTRYRMATLNKLAAV